MAKKEIDGNTTTEEITTIIDQPKTVGNTPAITVENGTELTIGEVKTVTVNQPQIAGASSAITVEKGTILTSVHDNDNDNILQECLDVFASYITVVDQYLKEGAEELADYNGHNWGRKFVSEFAQGYLARGGNVSIGKIAGVIGKSIWDLVYGVTAGNITMISHPLETIENAPAELGDAVDVYMDGNWTQKLELTLEMAVIFYGSAKLKKMGEGGATEAGKLAEAGETVTELNGKVAGKESVLQEFYKMSFEEQWKAIKGSECFVAGTLVKTSEGFQEIETIRESQIICACNMETGKQEQRLVKNIFCRKVQELIHICIGKQEICCSKKHPFWNEEKGWIEAIDVLPGDNLTRSDGTTVQVEKIWHEKCKESTKVYNLEIDEVHTYYVTREEILVHNASGYNNVKIFSESGSGIKKINKPKNVERQAKKLSPEARKGYEKAIEALESGDTRGLNDHPLSGNRSGQRAIDIKGTGKGRGAGRIIYEYGDADDINIIEILTDHKY